MHVSMKTRGDWELVVGKDASMSSAIPCAADVTLHAQQKILFLAVFFSSLLVPECLSTMHMLSETLHHFLHFFCQGFDGQNVRIHTIMLSKCERVFFEAEISSIFPPRSLVGQRATPGIGFSFAQPWSNKIKSA